MGSYGELKGVKRSYGELKGVMGSYRELKSGANHSSNFL
jgi:hypothetical protein